MSSTTVYSFGSLSSNARLGAGLLGARPFAEAVELVVGRHDSGY